MPRIKTATSLHDWIVPAARHAFSSRTMALASIGRPTAALDPPDLPQCR